ncbi:MAG: GNAT family N-acetyltransferase [Rhodobiaceae bacterium]|nr:GNAT family N-acetyltransferase [Rhodobiaceae bacterium]
MASLFATPGMLGVIATDDASDEPVGFVLMRVIDGEAEILTIGVLPEARGRGIGTILLGIMLEEAISTVFLDVAADNEAALNLYQSRDFEVVGRRSAYYKRADGTRVDSLTMKRVLG